MQPVPLLEKHLLFKPDRSPPGQRPLQVGAAQDVQRGQVQALQAVMGGEVFYLTMVKEVEEGEEGEGEGGGREVGAVM